MQILSSLHGRLQIKAESGVVELSPGGFCLIPASLEAVTVHATSAASLLWVQAK